MSYLFILAFVSQVDKCSTRYTAAYYEGSAPDPAEDEEIDEHNADWPEDVAFDHASEQDDAVASEDKEGYQNDAVLADDADLLALLDSTACAFDESYRSPANKHRKF